MQRDDEPREGARRWTFRLILALILVSVTAGAFAIMFRAALSVVLHDVFDASNIVDAMTRLGWWWRLALPAIGALIAGVLSLLVTRRQGGGVSDVMEAVALGRTRLSMPVTLIKSLASWFAIVCGGSRGREGPLIQFGGTAEYEIGTLSRAHSPLWSHLATSEPRMSRVLYDPR